MGGHSARVTELALRIAESLRASEARLEAIRLGGPVHDIGKAAVDPAILHKPSSLDPEELDEIRTHPLVGAEMIRGIASLRQAIHCVLHHHERWDGTGYPHRLAAEEIPFEARVLAVADAYDAMTNDRPYRRAMSHEDALAEVARCSGSQFDPQIADAFLQIA